MKSMVFSITILLLAGLVYAQSTCGPNPVQLGSPQQAAGQYNQTLIQQRQKQIAIDRMNAQYEFNRDMQQLQHNFRLQQMQNQGNPQAGQQAIAQFQQSVHALQQSFQQRMQSLNQQR